METNSQIFVRADLETTIKFLPKISIALQYHNIKLLLKFLVQEIHILDFWFR